MLLIVELELLLNLIIQVALEKIAVREGIESVMEHTKDFVGPKLDDLLFSFVEVLIGLKEALEHL